MLFPPQKFLEYLLLKMSWLECFNCLTHFPLWRIVLVLILMELRTPDSNHNPDQLVGRVQLSATRVGILNFQRIIKVDFTKLHLFSFTTKLKKEHKLCSNKLMYHYFFSQLQIHKKIRAVCTLNGYFWTTNLISEVWNSQNFVFSIEHTR